MRANSVDDNNPYNNNAGGGGGGFVAGGSPYGSQGDSPGGGKKVYPLPPLFYLPSLLLYFHSGTPPRPRDCGC
jgi:hypothetical protein